MLRLMVSTVYLFCVAESTNTNTSRILTGPFQVCKPSRVHNPVEAMRDRAVGARLVTKCGTKFVSVAVSRYRFPWWAVFTMTKLLCYGIHLSYGFFSTTGTNLVVANHVTKPMLTSIVDVVLNFNVKINRNFTSYYGNKSFTIPAVVLQAFTVVLVDCFLEKNNLVKDGDIFLHLIMYYRQLLL